MWEPEDGGYQIHDYLEYQRNARDTVRELRAKRGERQDAWSLATGSKRRKRSAGKQNGSYPEAEVEVEVREDLREW